MKICFDQKRNTFVHNGEGVSPLFWGKDNDLLPMVKVDAENNLWFHMKEMNQKAGPLIGILTSKTKDGDVIGNKDLFIRIQKNIQIEGGISFVYTLDDCSDFNYITGACYCLERDIWIQAKFPFPDIIYNRLSSRKDERGKEYLEHKQNALNKNTLIFNPSFIDKFTLYQLFLTNPLLKPLLPATIEVSEKERFENFLNVHSPIYVKPTLRSQGNGIFSININADQTLQYKSHKKEITFSCFNKLWEYIEPEIARNSYIAQKTIQTDTINDKKYDYRILCHPVDGIYQITGIGIRIAHKDGITTHVSKGGSIYPYNEVRNKSLEKVFSWIIQECGTTLSNHYGFFGEFTIDIGRDLDGKVWIYEVNAKPMTFDEELIEKKRMTHLINIFYEKTKFI